MSKISFILLFLLSLPAYSGELKKVAVLFSEKVPQRSIDYAVQPIDFNASSLNNISTSLSSSNAKDVKYLLKKRAQGDFKKWLEQNPNHPRSILERYVVISYESSADTKKIISEMSRDSKITFASGISEKINFHTSASYGSKAGGAVAQKSNLMDLLKIHAAWDYAGGWSLVYAVDNGIDITHPNLIPFNNQGNFVGGNFLPVYSFDAGNYIWNITPTLERNVDELKPIPSPGSICDDNGDGKIVPTWAGHGTHVSGLIAGKINNVGICKNCGVASAKATYTNCSSFSRKATNDLTLEGIINALDYAVDAGAQVINLSFGNTHKNIVDVCLSAPQSPYCKSLENAYQRGVLLVASSGNARKKLNFPASDKRVAAVGGLAEGTAFWSNRLDLPSSVRLGECPDKTKTRLRTQGDECGSNFTINLASGEGKQEATLPALNIYSLMYRGASWQPYLKCGDAYGDSSANNGRGTCTGTSMSAPIYTGIASILRSINPLVLPGDPESTVQAIGIRDVMASASSVPSYPPREWDSKYGYGIPRAESGVVTMLGSSYRTLVRNRLTPLFAFYGSAAKDSAYTSVPQAAIALMKNQYAAYVPVGNSTPGYSQFPEAPGTVPQTPAPRASMYVLTTEYKPDPSTPNLVPLYWLDRSRSFPVGCTGGSGCNLNNRDFLMVTTKSELERAHADGYEYRGLQGYVYDRCSPEPSCIPQGAERLYRACKTSDDDCALFLQRERNSKRSQGYTATYPAGTNQHIGYAYPNVDSDGDGLVDGFEYIIKTRPNIADSDGDGLSDGVEFPQAGVATSDPCVGPNNRCDINLIFADGFETSYTKSASQ